MKPNESNTPHFDWDTLAQAAQRAPRRDAPPAPYGLATHVLSLAREQRSVESLWFSWCLRVALATFALSVILPFVLHLNHNAEFVTNSGVEAQIEELVFAP